MKGGEPIIGSGSMVGLTSPPQFDTGGIDVSLILWESLLEAREEVRSRK